jgi:hypothetical protein
VLKQKIIIVCVIQAFILQREVREYHGVWCQFVMTEMLIRNTATANKVSQYCWIDNTATQKAQRATFVAEILS